jgi:hypothetical protein
MGQARLAVARLIFSTKDKKGHFLRSSGVAGVQELQTTGKGDDFLFRQLLF